MLPNLSIKDLRYMQYVAAITAALMGSCSNMITVWNSPAIAKLISEDSPIGVVVNTTEASWVASVPLLGFIAGAIAAAPFLNKFGPKKALLFAALPIIITWIVIAFTKSVVLIIVMRCVSGIGDGFIIVVLPLYLGEITDKDIRGGLTTMISVMTSLGNVFVLSVGPFVSYTSLTLTCAAVPLLFIAIFIFIPDSPYFLYRTGQIEDANYTLRRLLPNTIDETTFKDRMLEIKLTVCSEKKKKSFIRYAMHTRNFQTGLFLVLGVKLFMHLSGMTTIKSYLHTIIESSGSSIPPKVSSIIIGVVQLPSVLLAAFLMDRMGRKPLYIISSIGSGIALLIEGTYFYLEEVSPQLLTNITWLPTISLTAYLIVGSIGITAIAFVLMAELFDTDGKSVASSFCTTFGGLLSFICTKLFLPLSNEWGMYTMFWIFGCFCCVASLFGVFVLPETKGKSFLEIQEILKTRSCCRCTYGRYIINT